MIRVVVAEDSPTARHLLVAMLESDPELKVVGEATNGRQAVELVERLSPDLVTMDVEMPDLDGLAATQQIMMRRPTPIIVISSQAREHAVSLSFEATRAGALLVLPKPGAPGAVDFERQRTELVAMAKAMAAVKVVRRWGAPAPVTPPPRAASDDARATATRGATRNGASRSESSRNEAPRGASRRLVRLVAIAASTGGPAALRDVLGALPSRFPAPVVIVQHIAPGFVHGLATWLASETRHPVRIAGDGDLARIGHVYIAPDDRHLQVVAEGYTALRLRLTEGAVVGGFRPSATPLFESAAALGGDVLACILTGMGSDGVTGLHAVHAAGGRVIAQDEASSVVWGMPREAVRGGVADEVLPLAQIGARIAELVRDAERGVEFGA